MLNWEGEPESRKRKRKEGKRKRKEKIVIKPLETRRGSGIEGKIREWEQRKEELR